METSIRQNSGWLPPDLRCITLAPGHAGQWRVTCEYESESMVETVFVFESGHDPRSWLAYLLTSGLKFDTERAVCVAAGLFAEHFFVRALGGSSHWSTD